MYGTYLHSFDWELRRLLSTLTVNPPGLRLPSPPFLPLTFPSSLLLSLHPFLPLSQFFLLRFLFFPSLPGSTLLGRPNIHVYVVYAQCWYPLTLSTPPGVHSPPTMGEDVHSAADAGNETLSLLLAAADKWVWSHSDLTLRFPEAN